MSRRRKDKPGGTFVRVTCGVKALADNELHIDGVFVHCKTHPYYRAVRAPRADCYPCKVMWESKTVVPL